MDKKLDKIRSSHSLDEINLYDQYLEEIDIEKLTEYEFAPQTFFDIVEKTKAARKRLIELESALIDEFVARHGLDTELPVLVTDPKTEAENQKYIRIYEAEGRFVYNTKYAIGLRMKKAKN